MSDSEANPPQGGLLTLEQLDEILAPAFAAQRDIDYAWELFGLKHKQHYVILPAQRVEELRAAYHTQAMQDALSRWKAREEEYE